ncbi:unnamed protein product [Sphagnum balticum]
MRKVAAPDLLIIEVFDGEISQESTVRELMTSKEYLPTSVCIMDVVSTPILTPMLRFETYGKGASQLNSSTYWQGWSGFVIEESQSFVVKIDRGASEFDCTQIVKLK